MEIGAPIQELKMAMIVCPECRAQVSSSAVTCPSCGYGIAAHRVRKEKAAKEKGCLGLIVGLIGFSVISSAVVDCVDARNKAAQAQRQREADEAEAAAREQRLTTLKDTLPQRVEQLGALASQLDAALDAADLEQSKARMSELERALKPYQELSEQPEAIKALKVRQDVQLARLMVLEGDAALKAQRFDRALSSYLVARQRGDASEALTLKLAEARWEVIALKEAQAKQLSKDKRWIEAEQAWTKVMALVEEQPDGEPSARKARQAKLATVKRELNRVKAPAKRLREQEAARLAYAQLCGSAPTPSAWDGGIFMVELAVKQGAHDPDSIEVTSCTQPVLTEDLCWRSRCEIRGKNAFGAKVRNVGTFWISSQGVVKSKL